MVERISMKILTIFHFLFFLFYINPIYSESENLKFLFDPDDILIVDRYHKVIDSHNEREEKNRIYLSVQEIQENGYKMNGNFTIYSRNRQEKSFHKEEEYNSEFIIQKNGKYIVENKYKYPNFQSIPTFPEQGNLDTWEKPAIEVIYLPEIDLKITVPFLVRYKYLGKEEFLYNQQKIQVHKIQYEYELNHKVTPGEGPIQFIKGNSKGILYFSSEMNIPVYEEQNLFYEFTLKNNQNFREIFHIQNWYKKLKKLNKKELVDKFNKINDQNISVIETKKSVKLDLKNILFDFDSYELKEETKYLLDSIYEILKQYPDRQIEISGHTDNIGKEEYNQELSEKRAKVVAEYLISKGLDENQISYKGYGSRNPIAPNDSSENRSKNRRVEIEILTE